MSCLPVVSLCERLLDCRTRPRGVNGPLLPNVALSVENCPAPRPPRAEQGAERADIFERQRTLRGRPAPPPLLWPRLEHPSMAAAPRLAAGVPADRFKHYRSARAGQPPLRGVAARPALPYTPPTQHTNYPRSAPVRASPVKAARWRPGERTEFSAPPPCQLAHRPPRAP